METYTFIDAPKGPLWAALLNWLVGTVSTVGMVKESSFDDPPRRADLLRALEPFLAAKEAVREWPGSSVLSQAPTHIRLLFRYSRDVAEVLAATASSPFDWQGQFGLFEDLHFLRADGSTLLGSIAHEKELWMDLEEIELSRLERELAPLAAHLRRQ